MPRKSMSGYMPPRTKSRDSNRYLHTCVPCQHHLRQPKGGKSPTKVRIAKAMVFPVVMYRCESWTIKKDEHQKIDAGEDS